MRDLALLIGVVVIVASLALVMDSRHQAAAVCPPSERMYIASGQQLSVHCIATPQTAVPSAFAGKITGDQRRYQIAQRTWDYGAASVEQNPPTHYTAYG